MPKFKIKRKIEIENTFRNNSVVSIHDIQDHNFEINFNGFIDIENKEWNIGVIVGSSGSGKSTIMNDCFKNNLKEIIWDNSKTIIDNFPKEMKNEDIYKILNRVGLGTPISWLKTYNVLSNGEKMRVDLARALSSNEEITVFDEFTSVVDRNTAQIGSFATQKAVRKENKKFIAVACHRDIVDWLEPDWVYDTDQKRFFFIQNYKNQKDQVLNSILLNAINQSGNILESFTI
ncbi:MAG: ATP-binding cassette domain-containing protein [Candidatus Peregrinibacteria bacterium]|nr:ATP-binding cassette domain-containing protein [Candidatus Peregrinibacteria bacterium]